MFYSDFKILHLIKLRDEDALTTLFNRYYQRLCNFMYLYIPENVIVEELVANIFIKLWENKAKVVIHTSVKAYLYQSAKNQAISYLRKNKNRISSLDDILQLPDKKDKTPEAIYIDIELKEEFARAFKKLPPRAQLAFKLHRIDGLKYKEIAEIMSISKGAVEKNITKALKIMHMELLPYTQSK